MIDTVKKISLLKPTTKFILLFEGLDIIITYVGVSLFPTREFNTVWGSLGNLFIVKICATIIVATLMQRLPFESSSTLVKGLVYTAICVPFISIIWNIIVLVIASILN